ncbi:hypothetical protein UCD39_25685 [Nitrospirillum sp. BR 11752]|uniref:hypothetical protein n=1 Tax=Nitrospirillum sp. BR 11752 TaxID=3104293 RepID=UPI002EA1F419|nr:hypothetical protein [Nitrospirillum sp. BR 11752]
MVEDSSNARRPNFGMPMSFPAVLEIVDIAGPNQTNLLWSRVPLVPGPTGKGYFGYFMEVNGASQN